MLNIPAFAKRPNVSGNSMKQLELPKTLRTATIEEIPDTVENREWLQEIKDAKIV